jgi:predicted transcriptional regulator
MRTNRLTRARQRLMADPAFAADVARENVVMAQLDLARARRTTGMTQEDVAAVMRTSQENISRIERQRDVRVSTLVEFVRAQGGEIEITAIFDGTRISLLRPVDSA